MNKINKIRAILHGVGVVISAISAGLAAMLVGAEPASASVMGATVGATAAAIGESIAPYI